ncbi:MAG: RNA polymerase sporulation sigma factor SigG [Clostridia bacterium]|jgi:RNA polymerase sporulation-specific sigma factor|nr:RNA polymerase sporulation sigma factor SigG [Clostridia bacterium]
MAANKVEICGVDTGRLPRINQQKSTELLKRIKAGDSAAREEFITGNLRLVLSVIQRFSGRGESPDDLFQVGCVGLIKALDNFDIGHNVRFSTYAVPMIIGEIRRFLRDNSSLRVSRSLRDTAYHALQVRNRLVERDGAEPRLEKIAEELGVPESEVIFALDAIADPVSLNEPIYKDDGDPVYIVDQIRDENESDDRWLDSIAIEGGMSRLSERERKILRLRFFQGKTQTEVAERVGVSQAQVSRLEKAALERMRRHVQI